MCSRHFINAKGRKLRKDEVPSEHLPVLRTSAAPIKRRKPPREQKALSQQQMEAAISGVEDFNEEPQVTL